MSFSLEHISLPLLSPDHRSLASIGTPASVVNIWNITTGNLIRSIDTHASTVDSFAWSPTAALLATRVFPSASSTYAQVQVWNIATGRQMLTISSPDRIASGSLDGTIQIWQSAMS